MLVTEGLRNSLAKHTSPEWIFLCFVRWSWRINVFPHSSHSYLLSSWWTRKWSLQGNRVQEHGRRWLRRNNRGDSTRRSSCRSQPHPFPAPFLGLSPSCILTSSNKHSAPPRLPPQPDDTRPWPCRSSIYFTRLARAGLVSLWPVRSPSSQRRRESRRTGSKRVGAQGTDSDGGQWQPVIKGTLSGHRQRW